MRVARILRELAAAHGVRRGQGVLVEVALNQPALAALAGATEPTIQRVLTTRREDGVVETGYRRIHIRDEDRLAAMARR